MRKTILALLLAAGSAHAQPDRSLPPGWVWIVNQSSGYIRDVYASPDYTLGWGPDILSGTQIDGGTRKAINIDNGAGRCVYDIRIERLFPPVYALEQHNICASNVIIVRDPPSRVWPPR
jgi:hypothetical protein